MPRKTKNQPVEPEVAPEPEFCAAPSSGPPFEEKIKKYSKDWQVRYTTLFGKWLEGKANRDDKKELELAGLIVADIRVEESDTILGGLDGAADFINLEYGERGIHVNQMDISRWQTGKFLPSLAKTTKESFPASHRSGRRSKALVRTWVEKYLLPTAGQDGGETSIAPIDYEREQKRINFERSRDEFDLWKQRTSGKFMESVIVADYFDGFGTWMGEQQNRLIEDKAGLRSIVREQALASGISPELADLLDIALATAFAGANDAFKRGIALRQGELIKQLEKLRAEQIEGEK